MSNSLPKLRPERIWLLSPNIMHRKAGYAYAKMEKPKIGGTEYVRADTVKPLVEWQPIESAPKDGTEVILCFSDGSRTTGFFAPKFSTYGVNYGSAWGYGCGWNHGFREAPTHWMPLPEPPLNAVKAGTP